MTLFNKLKHDKEHSKARSSRAKR